MNQIFDYSTIVSEVKERISLSEKKCLSYIRAYEIFGQDSDQEKWVAGAKDYFSNHPEFKNGRGRGGTIVFREDKDLSTTPVSSKKEQENSVDVEPHIPDSSLKQAQKLNPPVLIQNSDSILIEESESSLKEERKFFPEEVAIKTKQIEDFLADAAKKRNGIYSPSEEQISILIGKKEFLYNRGKSKVMTLIRSFVVENEIDDEREDILVDGTEIVSVRKCLIPYIDNVLYYCTGAAQIL